VFVLSVNNDWTHSISSITISHTSLFYTPFYYHQIQLIITTTTNISALRELDRQNVIKSDPFILMQGDVVSNVDLHCAMSRHVERRMKDASAIMTILLQDVGGWGLENNTAHDDTDYEDDGEEEEKKENELKYNNQRVHTTNHHHNPPLRSSTDDLLLALDTTHSNRILLWDDITSRNNRQYASIPTIFFQENSSCITLTRNYHDVGIDICSPDILARFSDEFDYRELRSQFVSNCVAEEEAGLQAGRIYAHMLERGEYAGRPLGDMRRYHQVSMDLLRRWCYPLVPDNHQYHHHHHHCQDSSNGNNTAVANYVCERHFVYRDVGGMHHIGSGSSSSSSSQGNRMSSHIGRTTQLLGSLLLGPNYSIGERCTLQRSVLGPNCTLKDDVTIMDSHLWGNCTIENGASLSGVIVCEGAIIRQGAILERGCVVGMGCIVGAGVRLKEFTRITCAAAEVEDDDDYWNSSSSEEEDEDFVDGDKKASAMNNTTASLDAITNHDVVGKDGIGRVYIPSPPDDYDSDDDEESAQAAAMELMKSQSIGYDLTNVYRKWRKVQMNYDDDGFSLDELGSDDDDDDEDDDGYMGMGDDMMNNENAASGSAGDGGSSGVQITGRQKGIDVVKELRDICLEHETTSPVDNLRIELNSFKFSQNATYSDCCKGAMMAVMTKIVDESGGGGESSGLTPGKLVGSLKKMMEYWGALFKSICIGSDEEKAIIHSLELMALGQVGGSKFVSILGTEPAFRFVLQTLHDQEIVNEDAIFDWAFERKDESKDSPLGRLFWQKPNQDFLEWLEEEDSGSDNDGEDDTDEDSD
jgi:translation initiation factor eIF-2B subunit epsilon